MAVLLGSAVAGFVGEGAPQAEPRGVARVQVARPVAREVTRPWAAARTRHLRLARRTASRRWISPTVVCTMAAQGGGRWEPSASGTCPATPAR